MNLRKNHVFTLWEGEGSGEGVQIHGGRQARVRMWRAFKKPHKPTRTQFTGQVEPARAPELESRVNRLLAGEDKRTEKTSCPRVLLLFPSLCTWATWDTQNHMA